MIIHLIVNISTCMYVSLSILYIYTHIEGASESGLIEQYFSEWKAVYTEELREGGKQTTCVYIYIYIYTYICIHTCVRIGICMYIYIYMYTHTYSMLMSGEQNNKHVFFAVT